MSCTMSKNTKKLVDEARLFGYSENSWEGLSEKDRDLLRKVRPAPTSAYKVNGFLSRIEGWIKEETENAASFGGEFSLSPDFQRGHVWDQEKQIAYVENYLRGQAPSLFRFNNVSASGNKEEKHGDIHYYDMVCIDGLQRLTALREFMADRLVVFGDLTASALKGTVMDPKRTNFTYEVEIFDFPHRHELLDYYVSLNAGGVVHSIEEIDRVKAMSEAARQGSERLEAQTRRRRPTP
jgi:hypothetical protein